MGNEGTYQKGRDTQIEVDPAKLKEGIVMLAMQGHISGELAQVLIEFIGLREA